MWGPRQIKDNPHKQPPHSSTSTALSQPFQTPVPKLGLITIYIDPREATMKARAYPPPNSSGTFYVLKTPMDPYCLVPLSYFGYTPCTNGSQRAVGYQVVGEIRLLGIVVHARIRKGTYCPPTRRIPKVDPLQGSLIYTIGTSESRIGGSVSSYILPHFIRLYHTILYCVILYYITSTFWILQEAWAWSQKDLGALAFGLGLGPACSL